MECNPLQWFSSLRAIHARRNWDECQGTTLSENDPALRNGTSRVWVWYILQSCWLEELSYKAWRSARIHYEVSVWGRVSRSEGEEVMHTQHQLYTSINQKKKADFRVGQCCTSNVLSCIASAFGARTRRMLNSESLIYSSHSGCGKVTARIKVQMTDGLPDLSVYMGRSPSCEASSRWASKQEENYHSLLKQIFQHSISNSPLHILGSVF